jgi:hypothetical protein
MKRDKRRDNYMFNSNKRNEIEYVADLYETHSGKVSSFLLRKSYDRTIRYFSYKQVYDLIKKELNLDIPSTR